MPSLATEIRRALRSLLRFKGLSAVAIACMALGIGVCATLFAAVNPWLFRPLPFREPQRLVALRQTVPAAAGGGWDLMSGPDCLDIEQRNRSFESLGTFRRAQFNLSTASEPVRIAAARVSASLFPTLGIAPVRGRGFRDEEDRPGGPALALVGHSLWHERLGGRDDVVGSTLTIDGEVHVVAGVMPERFAFPEYAEVWVPLRLEHDEAGRGVRNTETVARLRAGVTVEQAQADLSAIAAALGREHPETNRAGNVEARRLPDWYTPPGVRIGLHLLLAAGLFVQLIACSNVANLLLAKAVAQRREVAIRVAIGASRLRLLRDFLLESAAIAVAGAALGLLATRWGVQQLMAGTPVRPPYWAHTDLDATGLLVIAGVTVLSALAVALLPALHAGRSRVAAEIKEGSRTLGGARQGRLGRVLVASELGLALVLLIGAALMVQSFRNRQATDPGLAARPALTTRLVLSGDAYADGARRAGLLEELVRRSLALPGVERAGFANSLPFNDPLSGGQSSRTYEVEGQPLDPETAPRAVYVTATTGYLEAMGIRLRRGRFFEAAEEAAGRAVVVVSDDLARRCWSGADPIGRRLRVGGGPWLQVVGVAQATREGGDMMLAGELPASQLYVPYRLDPGRSVQLVVNTCSAPAQLAGPLRRALHSLEPGLPLGLVSSIEEARGRANWVSAMWGRMMTKLAALALLLAALGVYGVFSHMVSQRTHEIGLRMAIGAARRDVVRLVLRQGASLALRSALGGVLVALPLTRALSSLLYGVSASDPLVFAGCAGALTLSALAACCVPALRAAHLDPLAALRTE